MKLGRFLRTVAPLKPIQIFGRLRFRLRRPAPDFAPAPPLRRLGGWQPPITRRDVLTGPTSLFMLNQAGEIARADQWNDPGRDKLWLYNLHYFDCLAAPGAAESKGWRRDLVHRWIAENPAGTGNGWEPYPTSLRIVNWIKWALAEGAPGDAVLHSLAVQARWLAGRLEWHLLGNHLFANAKALVFAGLFFDGDEAERWLSLGLSILGNELAEQVLDDGGHFELSPMYHAIICEDVLDLINIGAASGLGEALFPALPDTARAMRRWLAAMIHPDGEIALFNDAAFGIAPSPIEIENYAARLGLPPVPPPANGVTHLAATGYARLQTDRAVLILDVGAIGPSYLPGHAHADTLSFELSVDGRRVVVNGGTSTYAGPDRASERGTAAHSTVEVAGQDSSEVWASFRVGRRARIASLDIAGDAGGFEVTASHDGYRHLPGAPAHQRSWRLEERALTVTDRVTGGRYDAIARFHLAPDRPIALDLGGLSARVGQGVHWTSSAPMAVAPSRWATQFGRVEEIAAICAPAAPAPLVTRIEW